MISFVTNHVLEEKLLEVFDVIYSVLKRRKRYSVLEKLSTDIFETIVIDVELVLKIVPNNQILLGMKSVRTAQFFHPLIKETLYPNKTLLY